MSDTRNRTRIARRILQREATELLSISLGARRLFSYSLLICDDLGRFDKSQVTGQRDPAVQERADALLAEFGLLTVDN